MKLLTEGAEAVVRWAAYFCQPGVAPPQENTDEEDEGGVVAAAPPPDVALHLDTAAQQAARIYARLFDGAVMFDGMLDGWMRYCAS